MRPHSSAYVQSITNKRVTMRSIIIFLCITIVSAQYQSNPSWRKGSNAKQPSRPNYKNNLPSKYDNSYDEQPLPARLPIQAPNGVIEIYNRVVDDLIKRLEHDFKKRSLDPMDIVIRPTPPGPVRVPANLQKRPFKGQGAALYRQAGQANGARPWRRARDAIPKLSDIAKVQVVEKTISLKADNAEVNASVETTATTQGQSFSSEVTESVPTLLQEKLDDQILDLEDRARTEKRNDEDTDEEDDEFEIGSPDKKRKENVPALVQKYKYSSKEKNAGSKKPIPTVPAETKKIIGAQNDDDEDDEDEEPQDDDHDAIAQSVGDKPNKGALRPPGPAPLQAKPNAQLVGLSSIKRSSDVTVTVDPRTVVIRARLLVGPLQVFINESVEPQEKNVKAKIPEMEAELLLTERHGVVFLQRLTLDRAYGQDVEITVYKSNFGLDEKISKDKKKGTLGPAQPTGGFPQPSHADPNHPSNVKKRFETKMAAHVSMEIVKLLRSDHLAGSLIRVSQGSMSKLKLPIQKRKTNEKKKVKQNSKEE